MGFGYLFVGTVLTVNVVAHQFTDLLAYLLILIGMLTLSDYGPRLRLAKNASFVLLFVGACEFSLSLLDILGVYTDYELMRETALVNQLMMYVFTFLLLRGLATLADETGTHSLRVRVFRQQIFAFIYHIPMGLLEVDFGSEAVKNFQLNATLPLMLFGMVYLILQAKLMFSFYMWICPEGEERMERKSSRFAFINKLNAIGDKIDDKTLERKQREQEARMQRKNEKKHRKKKK